MKKLLIIITLVITNGIAFASGGTSHNFDRNIKKLHEGMTPEQIEAKKAELHEGMLIRTGGKIRKPGIGKGKFVVVNSQKRVGGEELFQTAKNIANQLRVEIELKEIDVPVTINTASKILAESGAATGVFVIDDSSLPITVLTAPESRWAMVNVSALAADGASIDFVIARTRKEIGRGLLMASNAQDSQNVGTLMSCVTSLKDLDEFAGSNAPVDVLNRVIHAMPKYDMERWVMYTYLDACLEGWAPAPKDKYQQGVWDKVHEIPSEPIKIKHQKK